MKFAKSSMSSEGDGVDLLEYEVKGEKRFQVVVDGKAEVITLRLTDLYGRTIRKRMIKMKRLFRGPW